MSNNTISIDSEELTITMSGKNVRDNFISILKKFNQYESSRPLDSHEGDLANDLLRELGAK